MMGRITDLETHDEPFITLDELAEYWRVSVRTLYRDIEKGALEVTRVGRTGRMRISVQNARAYGKPNETKAPVFIRPERRKSHYTVAREKDRRISDQGVIGVYFLRCDSFIKIGRAGHVEWRINDLSYLIPVETEVLLVLPLKTTRESHQVERELHALFDDLRVKGEWFKDHPRIREYIEAKKLCVSS